MYFHMMAFTHIRSALIDDMPAALAVTLVQSLLDYTNSILYTTSLSNIHKLQSAQNTLPQIVLPKYH